MCLREIIDSLFCICSGVAERLVILVNLDNLVILDNLANLVVDNLGGLEILYNCYLGTLV